jgi:hypothetical protein
VYHCLTLRAWTIRFFFIFRPLGEQLQAQQEAAAEEEERGPELGTKRQYLVVMRHGERIDEVDLNWRQQSDRPWDPPLSGKGEQQVDFMRIGNPASQA